MKHLRENLVENSVTAVVKESLSKAISYPDYRAMVTQLTLEGKSTGEQQSEALANYTMLNDKRMKRLDKTLKITNEIAEKLGEINKKITFLVLTESWCGDAAQTMPVMHKMAEVNANIDFKVVLREENLSLMNLFLTNGTLSIPKLVILNENLEVLADWGPRPQEAAQMVVDYKKEHGTLTDEFKQDLQLWYTKDKGQSTASDILACLFLE